MLGICARTLALLYLMEGGTKIRDRERMCDIKYIPVRKRLLGWSVQNSIKFVRSLFGAHRYLPVQFIFSAAVSNAVLFPGHMLTG